MIDRYRRHAIEQAYRQTLAERPEATAISEEDKAIIIETLVAVDKALSGLGSGHGEFSCWHRLKG